jgi:hypothetical protein
MNRICRETMTQTWRRRQLAISDLLRHAKIVTDPNTLKYLKAQAVKRDAPKGGRRTHNDSSQFDGVR